MAGSTSGGISDLAFVMNMRIDESSVTDAMKTLGDMKSQVNAFRMEHGIDGGVEQKKAAELEKEARFQAEFNQLLKEEAAEKSAIAARDSAIAQGREQHLAEQKRLLLDYYQTEEKAGQAREARFQVEFNQLLQLEAAGKAENQRIAAESITNQQSLDAMLESRQRAFNWTQGALATQRRQEEEATAREAAAAAAREQQNRASFRMNMGALSGSSAAPPSGPDVAGGMRDAIERQNAERMAGIMAAIDGEIRLGQTQQAHSDDAERRNAQRLAGIMAAADAELRVGLAIDAEVNAIEGDMTRALRRTLNIEDQINHDYQQRLLAIDAIQGATAQQTAELRLQAAAVRDAATQTAINAGQIGGIGAAGLTGNRIQEFGRGFEDFTVGFSMAKTNIEGIAMGLRGSANNAAQLAASFSPIAGAAVAIGASLATVIVPMVARWLWDTKNVEKEMKAVEEQAKNIQAQLEFRVGISVRGGGTDPIGRQKGMKEDADIASILAQKELNKQITIKEEIRREEQNKDAGWLLRVQDLKLKLIEQEEKVKEAYREKEDKVGRQKAFESLTEDERRTQAIEEQAKKTEKEAKAIQDKADKEEARQNKYRDMQQRIDADAGKATKSKEDDIMAAYNKRTEEINRLEGDSDADKLAKKKLHAANLATFTSKMDQEQAAQNDKLAVKRIDAELQANADQQDALQEQMEKSGNAAGPSAAMVSGTQAAESAINRALSGSQSVEGTMKAQLKVLQEIHKDLQQQKQAKTVSL